MILHLPPGSPPALQAAADVILALHVGGGCVGIIAGTAALLLRKGGRWHKLAGNVFFAAILTMASIGAVVSPLLPAPSNSVGGIFAFYLVLTGWLTVKRNPDTVGLTEVGAFFVALGAAAGGVFFGMQAINSPTGPGRRAPAGAVVRPRRIRAARRVPRRASDLARRRFRSFAPCPALCGACARRPVRRRRVSLLGQPKVFPHFWRCYRSCSCRRSSSWE